MRTRLPYLAAAKANEAVFRSVLRDLKLNRAKRPGGIYVPADLETEAPVEAIFGKYSTGFRYGVFTIVDFSVSGDSARIAFEDVAALSGGGAGLLYMVSGEGVTYQDAEYTMRS